jgi:hypothetical protein
LRSHHTRKSRIALPLAGIAAACSLLVGGAGTAAAVSISGQSDTILRLRTSSPEEAKLYNAYEYLRLSVRDLDKNGDLGFTIGGWGRVDLKDHLDDRHEDADLQYGYLSYRPKKNNLTLNIGRQLVTEGVASERLDGVYLRSDLAAGFGASAYGGADVVTQPNFKGAEVVYGARVSHTLPSLYTVGLSALKADRGGARFREEEGVDLWLHPLKQLDLVGRSSYNSLTSGWMENAYILSCVPNDKIRLTGDLSQINYRHYFQQVTTSALSLGGAIDPNEKLLALGMSVAINPIKELTIVGDFKNYDYRVARNAKYFGGKLAVSVAESVTAGVGLHRMEGSTEALRYTEFRAYLAKKFHKLDITADFIDQRFDSLKNTFSITGAAAYEITEQIRLAADVDYGRTTEFDNEVKGLVKLTYAFDTKHGSEGGAKSEK